MGKREIRDVRLTVAQANEELGVDMEPAFWEALVGMLSYPDVSYDPKTQTIRYPEFVPFGQLAKEWIEGIEQGIYDVRRCVRCAGYFDLSRADGIFTDPEERTGFLCGSCADSITAREFHDRYLAR